MKQDAFPPRAEARPATFETHGIKRQDDYAWLRADNWQEVMRDPSVLDADIRAYLEAENAYQEAQMAPTNGFRSNSLPRRAAASRKMTVPSPLRMALTPMA